MNDSQGQQTERKTLPPVPMLNGSQTFHGVTHTSVSYKHRVASEFVQHNDSLDSGTEVGKKV